MHSRRADTRVAALLELALGIDVDVLARLGHNGQGRLAAAAVSHAAYRTSREIGKYADHQANH